MQPQHSNSKPRFRLDHGRLIPIQVVEPGVAPGAELGGSSRGFAWGGVVTAWPSRHAYPLMTGIVAPNEVRPMILVRGQPLWPQEMYVYLTERKGRCWEALREVSTKKVKTFIRRGEFYTDAEGKHHKNHTIEFDPRPYPEDFGEFSTEVGEVGEEK